MNIKINTKEKGDFFLRYTLEELTLSNNTFEFNARTVQEGS